MTSRDFCFWLQGYFEISEVNALDTKQVEIIKRHLQMVFAHEIDPKMGDEKHQTVLSGLHLSGMPTDPPVLRC
jgi:hypothetical protein